MKEHIKYFAKLCLLTIIIVSVLVKINHILVPKNLYNTNWPTTSTYLGFYEMDENSIDVLFLGSSQCVNAFSPQYIYNNYGLRTFNLGCERQSIRTSYYWLKEALQYQKPMIVVLDTLNVNTSSDENESEAFVRKAFDYMRLSKVKWEAVQDICLHDKNQIINSYYFPNIRYHARWMGLSEDDFLSNKDISMCTFGYGALTDYSNDNTYTPFDTENISITDSNIDLDYLYLDKIKQLCLENDISLILVKTPTLYNSIEKYNSILSYAQKNNLEYYDFNEKSLYEGIGYEFAKDNAERSHANFWGAQKISAKMAEILMEKYNVVPQEDEQWERHKDFYDKITQNAELTHITDICEYLMAINHERYSIFIAVKNEASRSLNKEIVSLMHKLGLKFDLVDKYCQSYYAVIVDEYVQEEVGEEILNIRGSFRSGLCIYEVSSAGYNCGNSCSIKLNNIEYAKNNRGLNIVVYDNIFRKVIDSVCFDTYNRRLPAVR